MYELPHECVEPEDRAARIADLLMRGHTVGNFAGRMEYGPEPHGGRAVIVDLGSDTTMDSPDDIDTRELTIDALGADPGGVGPILHALQLSQDEPTIRYSPLRLHGEPVALTPFDAYRVIMLRRIDAAMLGNYLIFRDQQPDWPSFAQGAADA